MIFGEKVGSESIFEIDFLIYFDINIWVFKVDLYLGNKILFIKCLIK